MRIEPTPESESAPCAYVISPLARRVKRHPLYEIVIAALLDIVYLFPPTQVSHPMILGGQRNEVKYQLR